MTAPDLASEEPSSSRSHPKLPSEAGLASRYRSLFVIGRGGMGSVEAALEIGPPGSEAEDAKERPHDDRAYERVVALKRLLPDAARDKRRVDMFLREARLAAMLDHPNIVRAYDYGEIEGELYLAMEYVEGQPLSRVLRALADSGKPLSPSLVAHLLAEISRGLHAAHELADPNTKQPLHLVHRDVSPQNVMLGYDGRVRLLDFGVAKIETENVTKTGEVKGKTAYMSPEQAMGEPLDRRSDLFGIGAILFECLALRRMWGDGTDMDVIRKLALEAPPKLDECGVDVPAAMTELHARLVAKDVKDRPKDAGEVADALRAFVPDGERAANELRDVLGAHFGEQAAQQRARLATSLTEVAPGQADELRESVLPSYVPTPPRVRALACADAPVSPPSKSRAAGLVALALVVIALVVWRLGAGGDAPASPPAPAPTPVAPAAGSVRGPESTSLPSATAPLEPPLPMPAPSAHEATTRAPARPTTTRFVGSPPAMTTTTAVGTTPRPNPAATAPPPPDIDDHPF